MIKNEPCAYLKATRDFDRTDVFDTLGIRRIGSVHHTCENITLFDLVLISLIENKMPTSKMMKFYPTTIAFASPKLEVNLT